jgi:serine/threonine-protein kinase
VVLDFGISKVQNDDLDESKLTRSESLLGTVPYMAPEVTKGAKLATTASDQYALGVMLYECATGKRPFTGDSQYELLHAIMTAKVPPPGELRPGLPADFDELVMKAMHRDPAKRHASVQELGSSLLSLSDATSWAKWKDVFLAGDHESNPWTPPGQTVSDADRIPAVRTVARRAGRMSLAGWGFWAMSCIAAGMTFALFSARRAPPAEDAQHESPVPRSSGAEPAAVIAQTTASSMVAPAAAPVAAVTNSALPEATGSMSAASIPRRHPVVPAHPIPTTEAKKSPPQTPSAPPATKTAPQRGTNGAPIFE